MPILLTTPSNAQNLELFSQRVNEFTLENGLHFIVVERHDVPIISFHTYADVGSVNEVKGITGIAHLYEHMAFKGTDTVGTLNLEKELEAMAKEDAIYEKLYEERLKGEFADAKKLEALEKELAAAQDDSRQWIEPNELDRVYKEAGGVALNASTSSDATRYVISLPSNKIELWFALESDRFLNPVLREFFMERQVVAEERRQRVDNSPLGRLLEEFKSAAFKAHPYEEPTIGHMSDILTITRKEAEDFFRAHYSASNLTIALVGDVDPAQAKELAQRYFGRLPGARKSPPVKTVEPPQFGERSVIIYDNSQPIYIVGYHMGSIGHPDTPVFEVLADVLGQGRACRLHKKLVKEEKIAISAGAFTGYPGYKYPSLLCFFSFSSPGHTALDSHVIIKKELERLKAETVTDEELNKAKTRARVDVIQSLSTNEGIAAYLSQYHVLTGDWRNLFKMLDKINSVTAQDIQRVAKQTFTENNRTIGYIKTTSPEKAITPEQTDSQQG